MLMALWSNSGCGWERGDLGWLNRTDLQQARGSWPSFYALGLDHKRFPIRLSETAASGNPTMV